MSKFLSDRLQSLEAYVPGEQPVGAEYIKLNTNESPYPPAPGVAAVMTDNQIRKLNLYPNPDGTKIIKKIAEFYNVGPENVIIGNGSDELLAFAFLAFFEKGVVFPDITYGIYPVYADLYSVPYQQISLKEDLSININDYIAVGKNVVLANPNAVTGIALGFDDIEAIIRSNPDHVVLIDEAYINFGGESVIPLTRKYENLLVIHTYSKARSMAGARLAYAIAPAPITDDLKKIKYSFNPYNVNRLTQLMGETALSEEAYYNARQQEIVKTRDYTTKQLQELGFELTDSSANFLLAKNPNIDGAELYMKLKQMGILVRHWKNPRISDYIRITIGTDEQMDALIAAIAQILTVGKREDHNL